MHSGGVGERVRLTPEYAVLQSAGAMKDTGLVALYTASRGTYAGIGITG